MSEEKCKYMGKKSEYCEAHFCKIAKDYPDYMCESIKDCYYKQALQLREENEKLKIAYEDLNDNWCDEALKVVTISQELEKAKEKNEKLNKKINTYHLQYKADSKELDEYFKKEPTYILTIEKLRDKTKMISELCQHCGEEVKLINKFEKQYCPNCGESIKPCSLCDNDIVNCNYCELEE